MNTLESFVDQLLIEKGVSGEQAVMDEYRGDVLARVHERLNAEMIGAMTAEHVAAFNRLLDVGPEPEILRDFFLTNVPDYQNILTQTLVDFRASYLR